MSTGRRRRTDDEDSEREVSDDERDSNDDEASVESTKNNADHEKETGQNSNVSVSNYETIPPCDESDRKDMEEETTAMAASSTKSKIKITTRPLPIKKDPAFVPRSGQFFLHDDREDAIDNKRNTASEKHVNSKSSARYASCHIFVCNHKHLC